MLSGVKLTNGIMVLLMIVAASAHYLGIVSYISLAFLIIINVMTNRFTLRRYILILLFFIVLILNTLYTYSQNLSIDPVVGNFALQILFLLTLNQKKEQAAIIFNAITWQILISLVLGGVGLLGIDRSMLIDAGSAKGFSGFYALTGVFATPQLLGSVCLAFLLLHPLLKNEPLNNKFRNKIIDFVSFGVLLISLNRVNIGFYVLWKFFVVLYNKLGGLGVFALTLLSGIVVSYSSIYILSLDETPLQTIQSRLALILGVISTINFDDWWQVIFGMFNNIHFYLPVYQVDITYIENGFLFIFKYFGGFGILVYGVCSLILVLSLFKNNQRLLSAYAFYYLFVAQNFTNEYVSIVFPQIIYLLIYFSNRKKKDISDNMRVGHETNSYFSSSR